MARQAGVLFEHYLEAVHSVSETLSCSLRLVTPTAALMRLADDAQGPGDSCLPSWWAHIKDEPYRQALKGVYARLAATAAALAGAPAPAHPPHCAMPPYPSPRPSARTSSP